MCSNYTPSNSFSPTNKIGFPSMIIIPYFVAVHPNISAAAKLHFGLLVSLSKKEGYCWATDEQLAEASNVTRRQIVRWNNELENGKCIRRETYNAPVKSQDGKVKWVKKRKIFTMLAFNQMHGDTTQSNEEEEPSVSEREKNVSFNVRDKKFSIYEREKNVSYNNRIINKENIKERGAPDGATHTLDFSSQKKREGKRFVERAEHVKTTDEQHAKLVAEFGEEDVKLMYERLSLWKQNTPQGRWKPSDFVTCKGWVRKALAEDKLHDQRMKTSPVKKDESPRNREIAQKIEELAQQSPNPQIKTYVSALNKYLEFGTGPTTQPICINYEDRDFVNKARAATQRVRWKEAETYLRAF